MAENCPHCGTSLIGEPIPQEYIDKGYHGPGVTHYRRELGVELPAVYDGVLYWACPDCGFAWQRDHGDDWRRTAQSITYALKHSERMGAA